MKNPKHTSYFTRVEDKYVFRVSTAFWHLLIGIVTIAAISGVVLLAWSIIPPGKEQMKASEYPIKATYPPVEAVTLADLNANEGQTLSPASNQAPPPVYHSQTEVENDPGKPSYELSLSELKKIIPQDKWQPGYWTYPYGELAWQMHPSDPNYRYWTPNGDNVEQLLERSYKAIKAKKYAEKKSALDSYLKILKQVSSLNSSEVLNTIIYNMNDRLSDLHMLDSSFTLIATNLKTFSSSNNYVAQHLIGFVLNNPNATFSFVPFAIHTCSQFPDSLRYQMLTELTSGFYGSFSNNAEVQQEATEQFILLLPKLGKIDPAKALRKFYSIYSQKNRKRNEEIARINEDYNTKVAAILADSTMRAMEADIKFMADKEKKSDLRMKSVYAVGGGFIAIALLGTILTLLSIQRILRRVEVTIENRRQEIV